MESRPNTNRNQDGNPREISKEILGNQWTNPDKTSDGMQMPESSEQSREGFLAEFGKKIP